MKNIPIKNKELISVLDEVKQYYDDRERLKKYLRVNGEGDDAEYFCGDEYRDIIVNMGEDHEGFPDATCSISLKNTHLDTRDKEKDNKVIAQLVERYSTLNEKLCTILSARNCALFTMYPPGGFLSWHNNANASAYNLIFSWSETGDGYFKYVDGNTGEDVVMQDVEGWQCKAGYFGSYQEPWNKRVYHCAKTNCWRITVSFMFDRTDMSMGLQDEIIEEIMSDY